MRPEDLFDELDVREAANSIWESLHYRKLAIELVDAEYANAVRKLANPENGYVSQEVSKYVNANTEIPTVGMGAHALLNRLNISEELVRATSALLAADNFSVLDRLASNRIGARKAALNDYERRKRRTEKEKRLTDKAKLQFRANDNEPEQVKARARKRSRSDWDDS